MKLSVNEVEVDLALAPDTPLLSVLRNELGLKGTRFGCGMGLCGACMVLVDDRAVFSCDTPLWALEGKSVTTIEKIASDAASQSLIQAFVDEQAAQCGYCLSGIIVRAEALLREGGRPTRAAIASALDRNLCRCGTHTRILRAVERASHLRAADGREPNPGAA